MPKIMYELDGLKSPIKFPIKLNSINILDVPAMCNDSFKDKLVINLEPTMPIIMELYETDNGYSMNISHNPFAKKKKGYYNV